MAWLNLSLSRMSFVLVLNSDGGLPGILGQTIMSASVQSPHNGLTTKKRTSLNASGSGFMKTCSKHQFQALHCLLNVSLRNNSFSNETIIIKASINIELNIELQGVHKKEF